MEFDDPDSALCSADAAVIKTFIRWIVTKGKGPQQQVTIEGYFRILKMVFREKSGREMLSLTITTDVKNFIQYEDYGKKKSNPREKPVLSDTDYVRLLHFLYSGDRTIYPDERQRVQQALLMIIHASSGVRPSSVTRSRCEKLSNSESMDRTMMPEDEMMNASGGDSDATKLRYRDVQLVLLLDDKTGQQRLVMETKFRHFKGEKHREQRKTFSWFDEDDLFTCPVAHLIALALDDNAFEASSLATAKSVFSVRMPPGEEKLTLRWRSDILDQPILRDRLNAEISSDVAATRLRKLGEQLGYRLPLHWYCFRRSVMNAVDSSGSEEARNQISGHLDSRTYRMHYMDQRINLDVPAMLQGRQGEEALLRKLNTMGIDADPRAFTDLTEAEHLNISQRPDVKILQSEYDELKTNIRARYVTMSRAPREDAELLRALVLYKQLKTTKERYRVQLKAQKYDDFHAHKSTALIEAQLQGTSKPQSTASNHLPQKLVIAERQELADLLLTPLADFRAPEMSKTRVQTIETIVRLCTRVELRRSKLSAKTYKTAELPAPLQVPDVKIKAKKKEVKPSLRCKPYQCIFCIGNGLLTYHDQTFSFNRQQAMERHVKQHLKKLGTHDMVRCPHPLCYHNGVQLSGLQHFKRHVLDEHEIRLPKN